MIDSWRERNLIRRVRLLPQNKWFNNLPDEALFTSRITCFLAFDLTFWIYNLFWRIIMVWHTHIIKIGPCLTWHGLFVWLCDSFNWPFELVIIGTKFTCVRVSCVWSLSQGIVPLSDNWLICVYTVVLLCHWFDDRRLRSIPQRRTPESECPETITVDRGRNVVTPAGRGSRSYTNSLLVLPWVFPG